MYTLRNVKITVISSLFDINPLYMFRAICQFARLEISKLHNCLKTVKKLYCARRISQFVNSVLGLIPLPRSLATVAQLGWKLYYSSAAVIQPPLSSLLMLVDTTAFDGPNQLCTRTHQ